VKNSKYIFAGKFPEYSRSMKGTAAAFLGLLLLAAPAAVQAQYTCSTNADGSITIDAYAGPPWAVAIPTNINGRLVTSIGTNAFASLTNLASVTIPGSVISIGSGAFEFCTNLASVTIPGSLTSIGDVAFYDCSDLTNVAIPCGVTNIGDEAFAYTSLTGVTIPGSVINFGGGAFFDCTNLTCVRILPGVTTIGAYAFCDCTSLACVTTPGSVTNIEDHAFYYCTNLVSDYFAGNPPALGTNVFSQATNATAYYLPRATGWSSNFDGVRAVLWNPLIQAGGASFGLRSNCFGFNITGTTNISIVVEVCTNLAGPVWFPLQTVTLTNGSFYFSEPVQTNSPGRFYGLGFPCAQCGGTLQVTITPPGAVSAGAEWQVDGGAWEPSGAMAGFPAGAHTVQFSTIAGWNTPSNQIVTITNGFLTTAAGNYTGQGGTLQVTITPPGAVSAGAEWQVDGGAWEPSGAMAGFSAGAHTVQFSTIAGWNTPSNQTVTITNGFLTTATGNYTGQGGTVQVTITPPGAVSAGAEWQVDGGAWEPSGAMAGFSAGAHTVQFSNIAGWNTPSNQIVTVTNGFLTTAAGNYTEQYSYPYDYTANAGAITITGYSGSGGAVTLPSTINGLPVASIGQYAFESCSNLTSITIPATVTKIGTSTFYDCGSLAAVYFYGNAPIDDATDFFGDTHATAYYLPGTTGWGDFSASTGIPTALWTPQVQTSGANFGVKTNQFGFNITWASGKVIEVEVCTNLARSVWTSLQTVTLTNGSFYFSEPLQTNSFGRFYRIKSS
jgi:hypothetical protein